MAKTFYDAPGYKLTGMAAAASMAALEYVWVSESENNTVAAIAADTTRPIAVLYNNPAAGQAAELVVDGVAFVTAGGSIDVSSNPDVGPDATGKAVARVAGTDTTKYIAGRALSDAASGDIIPVLLCTPYLAK